MDKRGDQSNFNVNFGRFKSLSTKEKEEILSKKKAKSTNNATRLWVNCLKGYLIEKNHPDLNNIPNIELNEILGNFYTELKKKKVDTNDEQTSDEYRNTTLRCIRGALVHYFKDIRGIDIIKNETFLTSNEMFLAMMKVNKEKGLGDIVSYRPVVPTDMQKIAEYIKRVMYRDQNPKVLQHIVVFHIIYYQCRRGCEYL